MAVLIMMLTVAVAVAVLYGLRMAIGLSLQFMPTQNGEQTPQPIRVQSRTLPRR